MKNLSHIKKLLFGLAAITILALGIQSKASAAPVYLSFITCTEGTGTYAGMKFLHSYYTAEPDRTNSDGRGFSPFVYTLSSNQTCQDTFGLTPGQKYMFADIQAHPQKAAIEAALARNAPQDTSDLAVDDAASGSGTSGSGSSSGTSGSSSGSGTPSFNVDIDPGNIPCSNGDCSDSKLISTIIIWAYVILGIIAVIILVIAGIQYITSEGEPEKTKRAQATITYTVIGLIIATAAAAIVSFVTGAFS